MKNVFGNLAIGIGNKTISLWSLDLKRKRRERQIQYVSRQLKHQKERNGGRRTFELTSKCFHFACLKNWGRDMIFQIGIIISCLSLF